EPSIQCAKCAKPGTDNDARCSQCGGTLVRVCGDCQFKNSIAKRFCDRCGSRLRPDTTFRRAAKSGGRPGEGREPQNPSAPGATLGTGMDPFRGSAQQQQQAKPARPQGPVYRPSGNSEVSPSRNPTTFSSR